VQFTTAVQRQLKILVPDRVVSFDGRHRGSVRGTTKGVNETLADRTTRSGDYGPEGGATTRMVLGHKVTLREGRHGQARSLGTASLVRSTAAATRPTAACTDGER
jgi:hypothetical protein